MPAAAVRRLVLTRFRSYTALDLEVGAGLIVLTGANGAGKTNILEALSLLSPGRGLRRADPAELPQAPRTGIDPAGSDRGGSYAVSAAVEGALGLAQLGTGLAPGEEGPRRCRIDREPVSSPAAFGDHLRVVWLTPAMDGLFAGSAGERRRFLDRLVLAVDPAHGARVNALERALRNRNRLLEMGGEARWLDAAEREAAEIAVAVAAGRADTVRRLAGLIEAERASPFPRAGLALEGVLEAAVLVHPAVEVEETYRLALRDARPRDRAAGRTLEGPHLSDLAVLHLDKALPAARASTGEQKALLAGLVLAHARLVARLTGQTPLLLFDEVAAHFDPERRQALFERLLGFGAQAWLTGADRAAFEPLAGQAALYEVTPGMVTAREWPRT